MKIRGNYLLFWSGMDIYSNFYPSKFEHQGKQFKWSEQAVMYRKAKLFGADRVADEILRARRPIDCKNLGRSREIAFNERVWVQERENIYREVLLDKFRNSWLREELLNTGNKILVEASPYDRIWGIGYGEDAPEAVQPEKWKGLNLLGKVLMEVREQLKEEGER